MTLTRNSMTLVQELNSLHSSYVAAVNAAVASNDFTSADQLAQAYDDEAVQLIAERENTTHLLPINRATVPDTPLRRMITRLRIGLAA